MNCKSTIIILVLFYFCFQSLAQVDEYCWWPSKYGAGDQRGAANLLTPEKVLEANKLIQQGIEHMELEELARDKVYEFAFIFIPVPFKGASGSPGNPIAIK
jgi:hypothetical protein